MMPIRRNYSQDWLPSIFNDFFDTDWMSRTNTTAPAINVIEEEKAYQVEVAAPGMTKEDFNVHLNEEDQLVISMEKKNETKEEQKKYLRREFSYTKFQQAMVLPDDVDKTQISASVNNGVLVITLQKKVIEEKTPEIRQIEIM